MTYLPKPDPLTLFGEKFDFAAYSFFYLLPGGVEGADGGSLSDGRGESVR